MNGEGIDSFTLPYVRARHVSNLYLRPLSHSVANEEIGCVIKQLEQDRLVERCNCLSSNVCPCAIK